MKKIEIDTWLEAKFIGSLQENPTYTKFAYVVSNVNLKKDLYEHNIWVSEKDRNFRLTGFNQESFFVWIDDDRILFSSGREKDESKKGALTDFYTISCTGGEAVKSFSIPLQVTSIQYLQHGKYVFTAISDINHPNYDKYSDQKKQKVVDKEKENHYFEEIHELPFWSNGQQMTDYKRNRLYIYDSETQKCTPITKPTFSVGQYCIDKDRDVLYVIQNNFQKINQISNNIYEIDLKTFKTRPVTKGRNFFFQIEIVNHQLLAIINQRQKYGLSEDPVLMKIDCHQFNHEVIYRPTTSIGNSIGSDMRLLGSRCFKAIFDELFFLLTVEDHSRLMKLNKNFEVETVLDAPGSIDGFVYSNDQLILNGLFNQHWQELMVYQLGNLKPFTNFNAHLVKEYQIIKPIQHSIKKEGVTIDGWVLLPNDYDRNKKYPAVLDIHGGPKTVYSEVYYHEMQVWAQKGWIVFYCNPRGSDGKGNDFADIRGCYGTFDFTDIMDFTDYICDFYPNIDRSRLGVTGGSYGGFMTNWIIGHTDRFACAITQRSISNWTSFYGVSDIGYFFTPDQTGQDIYDLEQSHQLWNQSPLRYAKNFKTPTLIIHSKWDVRCPIDQGYQLFAALKKQGVDSKMVVFHHENHDLSRTGKPKARQKRLTEITKWFEAYLSTNYK